MRAFIASAFASLSAVFSVALPLALPQRALAIPSPLHVKAGRVSAPITAGATIGGQAGSEFSLLAVKSEASDGGRKEKLVLAYGDRFGQPQNGEPGYFHIAVDHDSKRVVIDLAQITKTAVDPKRLSRILASSKLIASSDMTMDPQDGSTNITLNLREPVKVTVEPIASSAARLVIELSPVRAKP